MSLGAEAGKTFAEGLATRVAFEMPYEIMQRLVDDVLVVSEEELRQALVMLLDKAHIVAEGRRAAGRGAPTRAAIARQARRADRQRRQCDH